MTDTMVAIDCRRPVPMVANVDDKVQVVCERCDVPLGLLEYESNGATMRWWRHAVR